MAAGRLFADHVKVHPHFLFNTLILFQGEYHIPACGKKNENGISDYIINGQDTGPNEWPWMAAIVSVRLSAYGDTIHDN